MLFYFIAGVIITSMSSLQVTTSSILVVSDNGDLSTTDSNIPVLLITVICTTGCLITILVLAIVLLIVCLRKGKRKAHICKMGKYDNYCSYIYSI